MSVMQSPQGTFSTSMTSAMDQPSGIPMVEGGIQDNSPVAASVGAQTTYAASILSGTDKNSPKGKMPYDWDKYSFLYNAYYELGGFYNGTALYKSLIERDDQYIERRGTSHYRNYFRPIIDATYLPVFSQNASRKTEVKGTLDEDGNLSPFWNKFIDDVDNRGNHIQKFVKRAVKYSNMLGVSFIIMDNFGNVPELTQEAIKKRAFPFIYLRLPQQVEPGLLKLDEFCNIIQIAFREAPETVIDPITNQEKQERRWKLWTENYSVKLRQKSEYQKSGWEEIPETKNTYNLGKTPVIAVMSGDVEEDTVLPHPRFYSIARCNLALYNIDSAQMRLIRAQMFAMLVRPSTKDNDPRTPMAVGPLQGIEMPPDTPDARYHDPFYLAPPTGPYTELGNTIKDLRDDLYRLAGQEGVVGVAKGTQKSGVSQRYDFQAMEWVLQETAKTAACTEEKISDIFMLYVPSEKFEYEVIYEDNYHPIDKNQDVQLYTDYISLDPGPLGRALALEQTTRSVFDHLDDEEVQPVIEEIREMASEKQKQEQEIPTEDDIILSDDNLLMSKSYSSQQFNNIPQKKVIKMPPKKGFSLVKRTTA